MADAFYLTKPDRDAVRALVQSGRGDPVNNAGVVEQARPAGHAPPIRYGVIEDDIEAAEYDDDGKLTVAPHEGEANVPRVKGDGTGIKERDDTVEVINILPIPFSAGQSVLLLRDQTVIGPSDNVASKKYYAWPFPTTMPFACLSEAHSVSQEGFEEETGSFFVPFLTSETNDESAFGFEGAAGDETAIICKAAGKYLVLWALTCEPYNSTSNDSFNPSDPAHPTGAEISDWLHAIMQFGQCLVTVVVTDTTQEPDVDTESDGTKATFMAFLGHDAARTTANAYQTAEIPAASKIRLRFNPQVVSGMDGQIGGGYMLVFKVVGGAPEEEPEP